MLFNAFQAIYIINLRRRTDRRAEMAQQLMRVGLADDPRVHFFEAVERSDSGCFSAAGTHGCYLSHLAILESESSKDRPILILEDDCSFGREALEYELPSTWDVFYGGFTAENDRDPYTSPIIGAHCMGYSAVAVRFAAKYLRDLLDPGFPPDSQAAAKPTFDASIKPPFDGAIVWFRRAHPELVTVFAQIARQRSSRSDIAPTRTLDRIAPAVVRRVRKAMNFMRHV